jgi:acetyl esterase
VARDPEYLAFMRRVAQARAGAGAASLEEQRAAFDRNVARLPRAPMAETRDLEVPGGDGPLRARLLVPPHAGDVALVYVHGGGWCLGDLDGWEPVARVVAQTTRCPILEIEHRQAPEHPFPGPLDDVRAALQWAIDHTDEMQAHRVGAVGDSSGGNLVAAAARHVGGLALQALIYPAVDLARPLDTIDDPDGIVPTDSGDAIRDAYLAGTDPTDPDVSPLLARDFAGLPPTVICIAEYDRLHAQGRAYAQRLRAAGVPITVVDARGLDHAFFAWGTFAKRPAEAIAEFGEAVRSALAA